MHVFVFYFVQIFLNMFEVNVISFVVLENSFVYMYLSMLGAYYDP